MAKMKSWLTFGAATALLVWILVFAIQPQPANALIAPDPDTSVTSTNQEVCGPSTACDSFIEKYINPFILLFSALVGIIAVISIIVAGIQYSASADDPAKVSKAKQRIFNTVIGLLAYIFLFAFLEYIIPGGLL